MSALLAVPTAVPAASISVPAPPFPLSATAARGGAAVVAVLFVPFSCRDGVIRSFRQVNIKYVSQMKCSTVSQRDEKYHSQDTYLS